METFQYHSYENYDLPLAEYLQHWDVQSNSRNHEITSILLTGALLNQGVSTDTHCSLNAVVQPLEDYTILRAHTRSTLISYRKVTFSKQPLLWDWWDLEVVLWSRKKKLAQLIGINGPLDIKIIHRQARKTSRCIENNCSFKLSN